MYRFSFIKKMKGHKNSIGELAEWCIISEDSSKVLSSHKTKEDAEGHLQDIEIHKKSSILVDKINLNSNLYFYKFSDILEGGVGDDLDIKVIPKKEVEKGMEIESEHSSNPEIQKEIVKDHEQEAIEMTGEPNYYQFLTEMESKMKNS